MEALLNNEVPIRLGCFAGLLMVLAILEALLSLLIKLAVIAIIGAPALAVLAFEIALNATSMFNHANLRLPLGFDRVLRLLVVTPDMHRLHHSIRHEETDSNFGFNLPWW